MRAATEFTDKLFDLSFNNRIFSVPVFGQAFKVSIIYFSKIKVTISKMTIKILNVYNKGSQTYNIHIFHFATTVGHKTPPLQTSRFPVTVARQ